MRLYFTSKWNKDEIKEYKLVKKKIKIENGVEISKRETTKIIQIQILKSNDGSDLIRWTEFEDSKNLFSRIFLKLFKERLNEAFTISYTTVLGVIDELIDKKDLDFEINLLKKQLSQIGKANQEKQLIEESISDEVILSRLLKSMYIFHFPYDEEFSEPPLIEDIEMANPFMKGNKLPGQLINSLLYLDESKKIGEIQIEKKYDQSALNKIMKETLTEIDIKLEKNRKKETLPLFVATEIFNYKIDLESNWFIEAKYEKVMLSENQENIETIEFEKIK